MYLSIKNYIFNLILYNLINNSIEDFIRSNIFDRPYDPEKDWNWVKSNSNKTTIKYYKPIKEYKGKYPLDDIKSELYEQHTKVLLKRDVNNLNENMNEHLNELSFQDENNVLLHRSPRDIDHHAGIINENYIHEDELNEQIEDDGRILKRVRRAEKKKKKGKQEVTKKKPQRTTAGKTSKVHIIITTTSTTIRPLKFNDSLRKCHRRKLMNKAIGNNDLTLEDMISREDFRKIYLEVMKPWNVLDGPKNPSQKIKKRLRIRDRLNFSRVYINTYSGHNYSISVLDFKKARPDYIVKWDIKQFQVYNTCIETKYLHQGRLSLEETAKNPNLTTFDLRFNDTIRNMDLTLRQICMNKSHIYRIKYPRRQDREHRPTYGEKQRARLDLRKYYCGTTPGETIPTRYYPRELLKVRCTPIKKLSKKLLAKQKKDRLKRVNRERRRRRVLRRKGFKVTNIPTPKATIKRIKIKRIDPLLRANMSFLDRPLEDEAFFDISKMLASEFSKEYDVVDIVGTNAPHRKQRTTETTVFYDENNPTTEKVAMTMKRSKQKLGLEKRLKKLRVHEESNEVSTSNPSQK